MSDRFPQLDRPFIAALWKREDGREVMPRQEIEELLERHEVDMDLMAELLELTLVRYQRLDNRGNKPAMREDIRRIIEDRAERG